MESYSDNKKRLSILYTKIPFSIAILIMLILAGGVLWLLHDGINNMPKQITHTNDFIRQIKPAAVADSTKKTKKEDWQFTPGPISMDLLKKNGCVADGFLSEYGDRPEELAKTIDRSKCVYLHRALETWLKPPDFDKAVSIMEKVEKKPVVYGMFLAEAIPTKRTYYDPIEDKKFHYDKMCRDGTDGRWGNNTCIPSIGNVEYRRYLKAVTRRAMDSGIQSFLFGQLQFQDEQPNYNHTDIGKVIDDMRQYAKEKGIDIVIGGQTNNITDEKYLRLLDYIEGGVGIDDQGLVENQPCFSGHSSCWALLWDKKYSAKANNVFLHLDWSGMTWDDMGIFARMPQETRIKTLAGLYDKFTTQDMGFMMPFLAVLSPDNKGCYGPNKGFYSPSKKFKCNDEAAINKIMPNVTVQ